MKIKTKYSTRDHVEINGKSYEILSVQTRTFNYGYKQKDLIDIKYHVHGKKGNGCVILEEMITKKLKTKFKLG